MKNFKVTKNGKEIANGLNHHQAKQTYDIYFHSNDSSMNNGFRISLEQAQNYVSMHNGTNHSYFQDFKGGMVQIVCHETEEVVYETEIF
jgi:hypothetical protein